MAWDMCNQDSVWSDIEVRWGWAQHCSQDGSFPRNAIIPVRGGRAWAWARRGGSKVAPAGALGRESQSYLNSSKFAILRWL